MNEKKKIIPREHIVFVANTINHLELTVDYVKTELDKLNKFLSKLADELPDSS